ncbi:PilW family protein [Opitutus terrae]|uniref:Prepilin-type N-terminal cleavage/methylation domain-containing protein n=1 Tax=Opitutus terrae (strain DSM 11246 / JCM 15787 / PB90-1) TaxID=452637 RepID=B1ZWP9_OPITP|nr:type II secretion system protein [Opitutus terrae]ACB74176.1 hypothetical protein Oter_0888 [Opitutus terrae PB90-1]
MKALRFARSTSVDALRRSDSAVPLAGFTLVELMVATTILGIVMGMTLVAYTGVTKRAFHTEATIKGSSELRYAADMISQSVRSASQPIVVSANGLQLDVPPDTLAVAVIDGAATSIGPLSDALGYKDNQQLVKVKDYSSAVATSSIFASSARPSAAVAGTDISTYFKSQTYLGANEGINLERDTKGAKLLEGMFRKGDVVTIPATAYGAQVVLVIDSVSNGKGSKTITFTTKLGVDVPNGTKILPTGAGRRMRFEVFSETDPTVERRGQLWYYPDKDTANHIVLATDVDASPVSNPADPTSAATKPFVSNGRVLTLNLQKLPRGTVAGRTVQGVQTTAYARTDPSVQ